MFTLRTVAAAGIVLAATAARGDGPSTAAATVGNPQYAAWARCRVGTAVVMSSDTDAGGMGHVHLEVTQVLRAVVAGGVTLSHVNRLTVGGKPQPGGPVTTQVIAARVPADAMRPIGTADVTAMGRAFTCHVYEVSQPGAPRATAYLNDGVPGGVVKLVIQVAKGTSLTFVLAATDAK